MGRKPEKTITQKERNINKHKTRRHSQQSVKESLQTETNAISKEGTQHPHQQNISSQYPTQEPCCHCHTEKYWKLSALNYSITT